MGNMVHEYRPEGAVFLKPVFPEEAAFCQHRVDGDAGVTFAEDESVALGSVRVVWFDLKDSAIQHADEVNDR